MRIDQVTEKKKSPAGGPACWKGKKIHPTKPTKMKGGKRVNNCIDAGTNESMEEACPTCAGRGHRPAAGGMDRPCDACDGTGKVEQSAEESFDPSAEPSHQDELMDIYLQNGEEALADALGLTPEQLDQEINEIGFEHGLHADDDREEIIYKIIDDTISNADIDAYEEVEMNTFESLSEMRKLAGLPEPELLQEDIEAGNFLIEMADEDFEALCESLSIEELELLEAGMMDRIRGGWDKVKAKAGAAKDAVAGVIPDRVKQAASSAATSAKTAAGDAVDQALDPVRNWRADRAEKKIAKLQKVKQTKQRLAKAKQGVRDFDRSIEPAAPQQAAPQQAAPQQAAPAEVPAEPAPTVATAPKVKAKKPARQLSMTPNAIRKREQRAKAKAGVNESYPMGMDADNNTNVSFNQTKKIGDATLNIHAQAKDMEELQKVLQMAGLDPDGAEKHMPEPDSVKVVDVKPMPSPCGGDTRYSTDKTELIDMLRDKLANKLN